ncbi:MAG: hypothetical protein PHQ96_07180 [Candidatus Omnitrophica bacterium]|nr:hypothetical protein [Candidatus Omnitrophota bacterium]
MKALIMFLSRYLKLPLLCSAVYLLTSCNPLPAPSNHKTEIEKNIVANMKKETGLNAVTKIAGDTLYVYITTKEEFLKPQRTDAPVSISRNKAILTFFNSEYANGTFLISYVYRAVEASNEIKSDKTELLDNVFAGYNDYGQNMVSKIFFSLQNSVTSEPKRFNFIVIYFADTDRGIESIMTMNETDFRKYVFGTLPSLEFFNRVITKLIGATYVIGDQTGKHVDYADIKLTDFINDILVLNLRREARDRQEKPKEYAGDKNFSITDSILKIFYNTASNYDFKDYKYVVLYECLDKKETLQRREDLEKEFKSQ